MAGTDTVYIRRIAESKLSAALQALPAVVLFGPSGCGKATLAERYADKVFTIRREFTEAQAVEAAAEAVEAIHAGVTAAIVDRRTAPLEREEDGPAWTQALILALAGISPEGAGKLIYCCDYYSPSMAGTYVSLAKVIYLSTMTLFESGDSSCKLSLSSLMTEEGRSGFCESEHTGVSEVQMAEFCLRGGYPNSVLNPDNRPDFMKTLTRQTTGATFVELLMSGLNANCNIIKTPQARKIIAVLADADNSPLSLMDFYRMLQIAFPPNGFPRTYVSAFLKAAEQIGLLTEQTVFSPDAIGGGVFASTIKIRKPDRNIFKEKRKRRFTDTGALASFLGCQSAEAVADDSLLYDKLFENLCYHELKAYCDNVLDADLYTHLEYYNYAVDYIIVPRDGSNRWAALHHCPDFDPVVFDSAVENLLRLERLVSKTHRGPEFVGILSASADRVFRRSDGLYVIPLNSLCP